MLSRGGDRAGLTTVRLAQLHGSGTAAPRATRISEPLSQGEPEIDQVGPHRRTLAASRTGQLSTWCCYLSRLELRT